jgi:hypothetical protein
VESKPDKAIPPEQFADVTASWAKVVQAAREGNTASQVLILHSAEEMRRLAGVPLPVEQYVTLLQAASMVQRSKDTLERLIASGKLPEPDIRAEPKSGKPHEWKWANLRPALEAEYRKPLPEVFPTL